MDAEQRQIWFSKVYKTICLLYDKGINMKNYILFRIVIDVVIIIMLLKIIELLIAIKYKPFH